MANMCVFYALEVFPLTAHTKDPLLSNNTTAALLGFVVHLPHCRNGYLRIVNYGGGTDDRPSPSPSFACWKQRRGLTLSHRRGGGGEIRSFVAAAERAEGIFWGLRPLCIPQKMRDGHLLLR